MNFSWLTCVIHNNRRNLRAFSDPTQYLMEMCDKIPWMVIGKVSFFDVWEDSGGHWRSGVYYTLCIKTTHTAITYSIESIQSIHFLQKFHQPVLSMPVAVFSGLWFFSQRRFTNSFWWQGIHWSDLFFNLIIFFIFF